MKPTIRQLTYLCALADEGGFGAAAQALNASQPALSTGVRELEKALDVVLVDRSRRDVAFTQAGVEAVRRARDILTGVHDFTEAVKEAAAPLTGSFRLGVIPTVAPFAAPRLMAVAARDRPKMQLRLTEDLSARLIDHVRSGAVDAALIALPYETPGLKVSLLAADPLHYVLRRSDPMADQAAISPETVRDRELLVMEDGHCLRDHALAVCEKVGVSRADTHAAACLSTLFGLVSAGEGLTIAPTIALASGLLSGFDLDTRPIDSPAAVRTLALIWRPGVPREADMPGVADIVASALKSVMKSGANS